MDPNTIAAARSLEPTYTAAQVRAAEAPLLKTGEPLMARAATGLARVAAESVAEGARVLVLAGSGDNGGDALYAAAQLAARARVDLLPVSDRFHAAGFAAAMAAGARRVSLEEAVGADYAVILDGILGIGASAPALRGAAREAVAALLGGPAGVARTIAVDLPSGLHPDTGVADDAVLPATTTVTFGAVKHGVAAGRGPSLAGDVVLVRIGLEHALSRTRPAGTTEVSRVIVSS